ncbi:MAG TPA: MBL fold metallo-hydrolase [Burkholderiales bacterium]|nr:MBL fold metallo-hydrolase [Burkholderiales bacterium]
MRFASVGSGSDGNGLLVEAGATRILVDCGFSIADAVARLARFAVMAEELDAVVVTHEHDDHLGGAARLARRFGLPVWLTSGTLRSAAGEFGDAEVRLFDCQSPFAIDDIEITPYTVPHDAREPAQFVFGDGAARIGLLTDAGSVTAHMREVLNGLDALVLECNHDLDMLWNGTYPQQLKQRIAGKFGHLDNAAAAQLVASVDCSRLQHLIAAHLSRHNNTPELAVDALAGALGCSRDWIGVADQHDGFAWRQVG